MSMYEALKEYFESVGGVVDYTTRNETNYDFDGDIPDIDEVAEKFGLSIDNAGDGLWNGTGMLTVYYLRNGNSVSVYDNVAND